MSPDPADSAVVTVKTGRQRVNRRGQPEERVVVASTIEVVYTISRARGAPRARSRPPPPHHRLAGPRTARAHVPHPARRHPVAGTGRGLPVGQHPVRVNPVDADAAAPHPRAPHRPAPSPPGIRDPGRRYWEG